MVHLKISKWLQKISFLYFMWKIKAEEETEHNLYDCSINRIAGKCSEGRTGYIRMLCETHMLALF